MKFALAAGCVAGVAAHGSMTHPRPRNAYSEPGNEPSHGADLSCLGDACFWYQVGCHIGCPTCTMTGKSLYPGPHCTKEQGLMEPINNDPETRSWDPHGQSRCGDFTKYNPWRAPGKAPVMDSCGIASGYANPSSYATTPQGYRANTKGSEVLPERAATYWKAGGTAEVGWGLSAQHGGGYSYRLCPKGSTLNEECFQSNVLSFASPNSTMHFEDGSHADIKIPTATYIGESGDQWRRNPIPGCNCDSGLGCGGKAFLDSSAGCSGVDSTPYAVHGSPTSICPRGTMFEAHFDEFTQGYLVGSGNKFSVMDEVNVPNKPGEYVLSWRWDCEETDQVWNSCADIVITDGPVPAPTPPAPTPSPKPTPTPSPSPSGSCDGFKPDAASYACYYKGCITKDAKGNCQECCAGCHLETYSTKGTYCMEDKEVV